MAAFRDVVLRVLPEYCYDEFVLKYNFFHGPCLKIGLSKLIGIAIIAGSVLVKVPQIAKILGARSAQGLSLVGCLLELAAMTASACYSYANSFPFSAWGETFFLILQTATVNFLVILYGRRAYLAWVFLVVYLAIDYVLVSGLTPMSVLWFLQALVIPLVVFSKMIQAYANYKNGGTGQLSAATIFMLFGGSVARVFTSIQETGDLLVVLTYVVASLSNAVLATQIVYYWKAKPAPAKRKRSKKTTTNKKSN